MLGGHPEIQELLPKRYLRRPETASLHGRAPQWQRVTHLRRTGSIPLPANCRSFCWFPFGTASARSRVSEKLGNTDRETDK